MRISDTDYIKILSKWGDFFIMCLWFEAENEKRKEKKSISAWYIGKII